MIGLSASLLLAAVAAVPADPSPSELSVRLQDRFPNATLELNTARSVALVTHLQRVLPPGKWAEGAAAAVADVHAALEPESARARFALARTIKGGRLTVFRFAQQHQGLSLLDHDAAVAVAADGRVHAVSLNSAHVGEVDARFTTSPQVALRVAVAAVQPELWSGKERRLERVLAQLGGQWRAVWVVELQAMKPLGLWRVLVDANAPRVLLKANRAMTAQGYVYASSPEMGTYTAQPLEDLESATHLVGKYVDVYSNCYPVDFGLGAACDELSRQATANGAGDFLITPNEGSRHDPFAEVQTYYHLTKMHDFYKETLDFSALDSPMPVAANFTLDQSISCNAAYIGNAIVIGLCDVGRSAVNFAYDALTIMHEYTHGAVDMGPALAMPQVDEWGLSGMPEGLNEGYADFFPATVMDDALVGRHVAPKLGEGAAFRNLDDFKACPADLTGEAHDDGQIWSSANWEAWKASNKDPLLVKVVFEAMLILAQDSSFEDAARATLAAAESTAPSVHGALQAAYQKHGLLDCGRSVPADITKSFSGRVMNPAMYGLYYSEELPGEVQHRLTVPAGAKSLTLSIRASTTYGRSGASVEVFVNPGEHVVYSENATDARWASRGSTKLVIEKPAAGQYFVLPVGSGFGRYDTDVRYTITPKLEMETVAAPGTTCACDTSKACDARCECDPECAAEAAAAAAGCTCGSSSAGGAVLPLLGLGLVAFGVRRAATRRGNQARA